MPYGGVDLDMTQVVQLHEKNLEIKHGLKVKEFDRLMNRLKFIVDFQTKVKSATPEELQVLSNQINSITSEDWTFAKDTVKRCYGITEDDIGEMENTDMLYLFDELRKYSSQLKKN